MLTRLFFLFLFVCINISQLWATRAVMFVSNDPSPKDKWHYTVLTEPLEYSKVEIVFPEQPFHLLLFIADYATNSQSEALLMYDIEVVDPFGKTIFDRKELTALDGRVKAGNPIILSEHIVQIALQKDLPFGTYEIKLRLTDWEDNTYQNLKTYVQMKPYDYQPYFQSDSQLLSWQNQYYRNPRPELALDGFLYMTRSELAKDESSFWPMFHFYKEIFTYNPFLQDELVNVYPELEEGIRRRVLQLLHFSGYQNAIFYQNLPDNDMIQYLNLRKSELVVPATVALTPTDLDIYWFRFLATGNFKSIQRIVATLDLAPGEDAVYRSQRHREEEDLQKALYEGVTELAWVTLLTQSDDHRLIKDYCRFMYRYTRQTESQREKLEELLGY
jgi:hypothetical protein